MENGVDRSGARADVARRAWAKDAIGAIALAEGASAEHVIVAVGGHLAFPERNAFGETLSVEAHASVAPIAARWLGLVEHGKRVALVAHANDLSACRAALRSVSARRVATVVHVVTDRGAHDAAALADLGWGMLFAAGALESLDLALVARRAAEDSGTPFFVVHERTGGARHVEAVAPPSRELIEVFVGAPSARLKPLSDPAHPVHLKVTERAFAERVPFALGSAMRELESLTGRRKDVLERVPAGDAPVMLVATGDLGDSLIAAVERLRMQGHEVGAIKLTALRPFPGPRLVKAMQRALAISVLETTDEPLAQSNPLTRELKAAFSDAMTWAPEYPGIGRIPRILSGVVGASGHVLEAEDIDAVVHNMLADERGKRSFVLGGDEASGIDRAPAAPLVIEAGGKPKGRPSLHALSMRGRVRDAETAEACAELCAAVVSSALGLHVRASVRRASVDEGEGFAFDLLASRDRPRGGHAPYSVRLVALEESAMLTHANPLLRLADEGVLAVPTSQRSADAVWGEIPAYAKAIVYDRSGSVLGWAPPEESDPKARRWMVAAAFAGLALANGGAKGKAPVDGSLVAREAAEALRTALGPSEEALATRAAELARRTFESHVEVPRATVERDGEAIRLGRRDTRASQPPR